MESNVEGREMGSHRERQSDHKTNSFPHLSMAGFLDSSVSFHSSCLKIMFCINYLVTNRGAGALLSTPLIQRCQHISECMDPGAGDSINN